MVDDVIVEDPTKSTLKIFGSFGPAGSIVTLCERICRSVYSSAYYQQDSLTQTKQKGAKMVHKLKTEFVHDLFARQEDLDQKMHSDNDTPAYALLADMIHEKARAMQSTTRENLEELRLRFPDDKQLLRELDVANSESR